MDAVRKRRRWLIVAAAVSLLGAPPRSRGIAAPFTRGDCNADGSVLAGRPCEITDAIYLLDFLFRGGARPSCLRACDSNADDGIDIADAVHALLFCFAGGSPPPPPFESCGEDAPGAVGCQSFPPCTDPGCSPQDARAVGDCEAVLGWTWNGARCEVLVGCSCEGEDCDELFASPDECRAATIGCPADCDAMDIEGRGLCRVILGYFWDGLRCKALTACECVGEDCDELYSSQEECDARQAACPSPCRSQDAAGLGPCDLFLGVKWNGSGCEPLSGCSCEGEDCDDLFAELPECEEAFGDCL